MLIGLGVTALVVMAVSTLLAVIARYLGVDAFAWSYEVAGFAFIWVCFLGVIEAELRGENAAFELLRRAFLSARLGFRLAENLLLGAIGVWLFASGIALLLRFGMVPTPLLGWPSAVFSAAAPFLGMTLAVIAALRLLLLRRETSAE